MSKVNCGTNVPRIGQDKATAGMQPSKRFNSNFLRLTHMKKTPLIAIAIFIAACSAFAQTAPDAAELTRLLNDFLAGASRGDATIHERFWADDLIYTRSAGRRVNKDEVMHDVRSAPAPKPTDPKTVYTAEDIRIQQYGDTAV